MKERCESLVEAIIHLDGVNHAAIVTPSRKVIATAGAGNSLQSDNAWRALADTYNLLDLNKLPSDRLLWRFGKSSVLAIQVEGFTLGVMIDAASLKNTEPLIQTQFEDFVANLPSEARSA